MVHRVPIVKTTNMATFVIEVSISITLIVAAVGLVFRPRSRGQTQTHQSRSRNPDSAGQKYIIPRAQDIQRKNSNSKILRRPTLKLYA